MRLGGSTAEASPRCSRCSCPARWSAATSPSSARAVAVQRSPRGSVAASVSYVDGVTGANIFVMTAAGARKLAAWRWACRRPEDGDPAELSELELSALGRPPTR